MINRNKLTESEQQFIKNTEKLEKEIGKLEINKRMPVQDVADKIKKANLPEKANQIFGCDVDFELWPDGHICVSTEDTKAFATEEHRYDKEDGEVLDGELFDHYDEEDGEMFDFNDKYICVHVAGNEETKKIADVMTWRNNEENKKASRKLESFMLYPSTGADRADAYSIRGDEYVNGNAVIYALHAGQSPQGTANAFAEVVPNFNNACAGFIGSDTTSPSPISQYSWAGEMYPELDMRLNGEIYDRYMVKQIPMEQALAMEQEIDHSKMPVYQHHISVQDQDDEEIGEERLCVIADGYHQINSWSADPYDDPILTGDLTIAATMMYPAFDLACLKNEDDVYKAIESVSSNPDINDIDDAVKDILAGYATSEKKIKTDDIQNNSQEDEETLG